MLPIYLVAYTTEEEFEATRVLASICQQNLPVLVEVHVCKRRVRKVLPVSKEYRFVFPILTSGKLKDLLV